MVQCKEWVEGRRLSLHHQIDPLQPWAHNILCLGLLFVGFILFKSLLGNAFFLLHSQYRGTCLGHTIYYALGFFLLASSSSRVSWAMPFSCCIASIVVHVLAFSCLQLTPIPLLLPPTVISTGCCALPKQAGKRLLFYLARGAQLDSPRLSWSIPCHTWGTFPLWIIKSQGYVHTLISSFHFVTSFFW